MESTATPETDTPLTPGPEIDINQIPPAIAVSRPVSGLRQEVVVSEVVEVTPEAPSTDALLSSIGGPELSELKNPDLAGAVKAALAPINPNETTDTQLSALAGRESPSSVTGESHRSSTSSQPTSVDDLTKVEAPVLPETIKAEVELIPEISEPEHLTGQ